MIRNESGLLSLEGNCDVEEAEPLLEAFLGGGVEGLDLSRCHRLHTALLQLILAARVPVVSPPPEPTVAALLHSALEAAKPRDAGA